jgi:N-acetylglucosamine kinase-like BadF-type ATPase
MSGSKKHMECVLAVDGGNTKTIAIVAALDGTILGYGRGGCGDIYNSKRPGRSTEASALEHIEEAITTALTPAGTRRDELISGVFNMAGADWPEDFALFESELQARGFGRRILVQNDALGVLHAGLAGKIGVSVVCGTGNAIGARGPDGCTWHASYWQMDVQGSAIMSHMAVTTIVRSLLGIEPPTSLTTRVLELFSLQSVEELLHNLTCRDHSLRPHRIDRLIPLVFDEAEVGDQVARRILQLHGRNLAEYAIVAAHKVGFEGRAFPLILAGSVFRHPSSILADAVSGYVRETLPTAQPRRADFEPVIGTLFSALELAGITLDASLLARLVSTIPDRALFETASPHPFLHSGTLTREAKELHER